MKRCPLKKRMHCFLYALVGVSVGFLASIKVGSATDLYVGSNTSGNSTNFTSGTNVFSNGYIGYSNSSLNSLTVTGSNTVLQFSNGVQGSSLMIGDIGSYNTMSVSNGAVVTDVYGFIGVYSNSISNTVIVNGIGLGAVWSNSGSLSVGTSNSLIITNGGSVYESGPTNSYVHGSVIVTGTNIANGATSLFSNGYSLYLDGGSNSLVISNGGKVLDSNSYINNITNKTTLLVTGTNSLWSNSGTLYLGTNSNGGNSLVVSNGGSVVASNTFIGTNTSSQNIVTVTGTNSNLKNIANLYIGYAGNSNQFIASNSALIIDSNGYIGSPMGSFGTNNSATITGSNTVWYNSGSLYVGNGGYGSSLTISNGAKVIDNIGYVNGAYLTNSDSVLITGSNSLWSNNVVHISDVFSGSATITVTDGGTLQAFSMKIGQQGQLNIGRYSNNDSAGLLKIALITNNGIINFNQTNTVLVTSSITDDGYGYPNGSINQLGSGTTILSGFNSYSGGTFINVGTLALSNNSALGTSTLTFVSNSTVAGLSDLSISNNIVINSNSIGTLDSGSNSLSIGGIVSGAGGLNIAGAGTTILTASNSYSGNTTITYGTLQVGGSNGTLGSGSVTDNASLSFNRSDSCTFSNAISGSGSLTQLGTGTTILSGSNSYSGGTTISAGTLMVIGTNMSGTNTISNLGTGGVIDNAVLNVSNNYLQYILSNSISGTGSLAISGHLIITGSNSYSGGTRISNSYIQVGNGGTSGSLGSGSVSFSGILGFDRSDIYTASNNISGLGTVAQIGSGTLILAGTNNYNNNGYNPSSQASTLLDGGTTIVTGSISNTSGILFVGYSNSGVTMVISNGGKVLDQSAVIGTNYSSNNTVIVTGAGSIWSNQASVTLGSFYGGSSLIISNGAKVFDSSVTLNGSNSIVVTGSQSMWSNTGDLSIQGFPNGMNIMISNGGTVDNANGSVGYYSSSNSAIVTGINSLWSNSGSLIIGNYNSSNNSLIISNGGTVDNANGYVGYTSSSSNSVIVTGRNSLWSNNVSLTIGADYNSSKNSLIISNGGSVLIGNTYIQQSSYIGYSSGLSYNSSSSNSVVVTGSNSLWSNSGSLYIGQNSSGNSLIISNGGSVIQGNPYSGAGQPSYIGNNGSGNSVIVTGRNSLWSNSGSLIIGNYNSSKNSLIISNGGSVLIGSSNSQQSSYIGYNSSIVVAGTNSLWSMSGQLVLGTGGGTFYNPVTNSLVISNGGVVLDGSGWVNSGYSSNLVTVTGVGSTWSNNGNLQIQGGSVLVSNNASVIASSLSLIGSYSVPNLTVSSGGRVQDTSCTMDSSSVLIEGSNSLWFNSSQLLVGYSAGNASMVISNGGQVEAGSTYPDRCVIGQASSSSNNSVLVTDRGSQLSGCFNITVGDAGNGTLTVANSGSVSASNIVIASQAGSIGTLNIGSYGGSDTAGFVNAPNITLGSGSGTINFNQSDTAAITNVISGTGSVNQLGSGTTILSAANTFDGSTVISSGTIVISATGSLSGSGTTTVNSGGTLQNNGLVAGTIIANGIITGNGGTFGTLNINGGSGLIWDISSLTGTAGIGWDVLNTTNLDLSGISSSNKMTIYIYGGTGTGDGSASYTFNFLSASNAFNGFNMSNFTINTSNFAPSVAGTWSIGTNSISGGGEALSLVYVVPEPSTYALLGLGAIGLLVVMRRKFV